MAAMVAPCADSVQNALDLLPASRLERRRGDGAASAKSRLVFLKAQRLPRLRGSARPGRAAAAAHTHASQPRGPRKTARTQSTRAGARRRDSENLAAAARRPELARARGHVAAAVRATHQKHITQKIAPMRPHTPATQNRPKRRPASLQRDQSRVSEDDDDIHVIKRNGKKEVVRYDKITSRIKKLCYGLDSKYIKPNVPRQRLFRTFPNFKLRRRRRRDVTSS